MGEENQNTTVSLKDRVKQFLDFQMNARKQQAQDFWLKRAKQQQDLYTSWLNSTNPEISKQCTKAVRIGQIAEWIRDYFSKPENWWMDYANIEPVPLVDNYISQNPDRKAQLYDYVLEDNQICDPTQLYIDMWWIDDELDNTEKGSASNTWTNIAWWLTESALWLPKFAWKVGADLAAWSIKALWWDEERANAARDDVQWFIDKIWFWDEESTAYQATNIVWDLWQLLIPWVWAEKWTQLLSKYPKIANVIEKIAASAEKYPVLTKLLKRGSQWVDDTIRFNAINQEYTSPEEMIAWWLLNIAFGKWWEVVKKVTNTMWIKWLVNASKAKEIVSAIKKEWWTIDDLASWFNARWFKWSKDEIIAQLEKHWDDARQLKLELLKTSNNPYKSEEATEILKELQKYYKGSVWQKADYDRISKLIKEWDMYTPSELDNIQYELGKSPLNPFRESKIWEVKDSKLSDMLGKDYNKVKALIEDIWEKEWLWNIKALNNEIMVSNKLKEWTTSKSIAEEIKNGLKWYALPWAIMWYITEWDFEWAIKWAWAAYTLKLLGSTKIRTYLSNSIQKLKWTEKVSLTKWLDSGGKQALTDADSQVLARLLEESEWETRNEIVNIMVNALLEWPKKWAVVWWAEIVDTMTED